MIRADWCRLNSAYGDDFVKAENDDILNTQLDY